MTIFQWSGLSEGHSHFLSAKQSHRHRQPLSVAWWVTGQSVTLQGIDTLSRQADKTRGVMSVKKTATPQPASLPVTTIKSSIKFLTRHSQEIKFSLSVIRQSVGQLPGYLVRMSFQATKLTDTLSSTSHPGSHVDTEPAS